LKTKTLSFAFFLFFSLPVIARENTDVIVMKNGDRMTGQIKGLYNGALYVSLPYVIQTFSVDWTKVARLESTQLFIVTAADGSVYEGTLKVPETEKGRPVRIEVLETPQKQVTIDQDKVVTMAWASNEFRDRFNGALNTGIIYTKGNENVQLALGSQVEYLQERWSASSTWNSSLSNSSGAPTATRNEFGFAFSHLLPWNNYYYSALSDFLQSSVQGIQLQSSVGAGIGHYWTNPNRARLSLLGGIAWQNTRYNQNTVGAGTQNFAAGIVATDLQLFKFNKTTLDVTGLLFPMLNEPGRIKFNMNATYYIKITGNLSWNFSFYGNWDNRPPPHLPGSDYGTSSGLSWTFGMK